MSLIMTSNPLLRKVTGKYVTGEENKTAGVYFSLSQSSALVAMSMIL